MKKRQNRRKIKAQIKAIEKRLKKCTYPLSTRDLMLHYRLQELVRRA